LVGLNSQEPNFAEERWSFEFKDRNEMFLIKYISSSKDSGNDMYMTANDEGELILQQSLIYWKLYQHTS